MRKKLLPPILALLTACGAAPPADIEQRPHAIKDYRVGVGEACSEVLGDANSTEAETSSRSELNNNNNRIEAECQNRCDDDSPEKKGPKTKRVELLDYTEFFKSPDGKIIAYGPNHYNDKIFISDDGIIFYELRIDWILSPGPNIGHTINYDNPHNLTTGEFTREGDKLTLNGKTYGKIDSPQFIEAVMLPDVRQEEYSFTLKNGERLTVTSNKYNTSFEYFRLFIGNREIPIEGVSVFQGIYIDTSEGSLYVPSPTYRWEKTTWKGEEIEWHIGKR